VKSRPVANRTLLAILVATVSGVVWPPIAEAQKPIRIGGSNPLTGAYAQFGQARLRGVGLCVKHTNEKGGVLGRKLELVMDDDRSEASTAARIYDKVIRQGKVEAILGPYTSPITEAVADVTERHRIPMLAYGANTSPIFKKGRRFMFMVGPPNDRFLEGLIDLAARRGLKTVAILNEDMPGGPRAIAQGAVELAKRKGLQVVLAESYPTGTTDFTPLLKRARAVNADVLAAATYFEDAVAITRQLKELNIDPKMFGVTIGGALPRFYEALGKTAEFVYAFSLWEPELVTLRAGGLIPVARQYPGAREYVEAYRKEFPGAEPSQADAIGYGACQILVEAVKRAGSLDGEKMREAILKMDVHTVYGAFRVDQDGVQVAYKVLLAQWQDGKKVIVWPDELAPVKARFPTPPWSQRP